MVWYALKRIYEIRRYIGKSLITILFIIVMLCSSFCSEAYCSEGMYVQQHTDYYESEDYKQQISGYQGVMESLHKETKNDSSILGYNILEYIKRMVTLDWKNITGAEEYEILLAEVMMNDFSMSGMEEQYKDHLGNAVIEVGKAINKNFENVVNKGNATKINEARKKYQELFSKLENLDYGTDEYKKAYDEYKNWVNANTDLVKKKTFANHLGIAITATASVVKTNADFLTYLEYAEAYNLMSDDFVKVLKRYQELLNNQDEVKRIKEKYDIDDPFFVEALISGINNFVERMEKYKGKNNIQLAGELIKETGDNLTYDVTTDKVSDVLKGVFPLVNGTLIFSEVGQIIMDNADSDYDKIAYSGNMIARMYYVQAFMKETVDVLGMELSSQPDYEHAQLFDESVNIYKATMSNSTKYAQLYTEKKLEEFRNEINKKENSWWPLDKKRVSKLKSWVEKFEKYKDELETFTNSIAEVNCHNSDIMVVEIEDQETYEDKNELDQGSSKADLIDIYIRFIQSQNDAICYLIYDIDKDGYPEIFIERENIGDEYTTGVEYRHDIFSYYNGEFKLLDTWYGSGYSSTYVDIYASFPQGNGILSHAIVWGNETLVLYKLNNGRFESEIVYENVIEDSCMYYRNEEDQLFKDSYYHNNFLNHQYYQSETSSSYCEGSYLLAQSAIDNYTAIYEAFEIDDNSNQESNRDSKGSKYEITIEELKTFIGKTPEDVFYETVDGDWWGDKCLETTNKYKMFNSEGKIRFFIEDNLISEVFLSGDFIPYEEINRIIQYIDDMTGEEGQELYDDEIFWKDSSDNVGYYIKYHELPLSIGVKAIAD